MKSEDFSSPDTSPVSSGPQPQASSELRLQPHLEVYSHAVVLTAENNLVKTIWVEGGQTREAQERYKKITEAFSEGFLDVRIEEAKSARVAPVLETHLSAYHKKALDEFIFSITPQRGRALVQILVLQLAIKAICPEQDVRLHKGSKSISGNENSKFSWAEGVSMRRLDDTFIVPTLRKYGLLRMNEYGAFMTRTFAENYPYTLFYKAEISGSKRKWLQILDELEEGRLDANTALLYVLDVLWKNSEQFNQLVEEVLLETQNWVRRHPSFSIKMGTNLIKQHIEQSEARARLLEVAMHSLLQTLEDLHVDLGGYLKPLMPMRTANLKHGNFGDIEIIAGDFVVEAWDAKYDNPYVNDALDVLIEKIRGKNVVELEFGYVLLPEKKDYPDVQRKIAAFEEVYGLKVQVYSFDDWVQIQSERANEVGITEQSIAALWLQAYVESLALMREERAPIDEPTYDWLVTLRNVLERL